MRLRLSALLGCAALIVLTLLCGIILHDKKTTSTDGETMWGSFTNASVISDDGKYRAEYGAWRQENGVRMIRVNIYDNASGALADCFVPARAMDFWGVCWEENAHNLWIQSADIGICCYREENGRWRLDPDAVRPKNIVSKWD